MQAFVLVSCLTVLIVSAYELISKNVGKYNGVTSAIRESKLEYIAHLSK